MNLFTFASNDQSLVYLSQIFGTMNGIIPSASNIGVITLLGTMFKTFNAIVLIVGVLMVVYVTVVGVMLTAHEGQFMGKDWNNPWIPIRMVIGIAALVPTGAGYSALQMIMMWVIIQGVGAADTMWNTVLGYITVVGSPYAQVQVPNVGVYPAMQNLFEALTCDASARITNANPSGLLGGGYYCGPTNHPNDPFCTSSLPAINPNTTVYSLGLGPGQNCGVLTYCDVSTNCTGTTSTSIECGVCKAQVTALQAIVPTLAGISKQFVAIDYNYQDFYFNSYRQQNNSGWEFVYNYCRSQNPPIPSNECCIPSKLKQNTCQATISESGSTNFPAPMDTGSSSAQNNPSDQAVQNLYWPYGLIPLFGNVDFINTASNFYMDQINGAITSYIQQQSSQTSTINTQLQDASKYGWIFAGAYYYSISKINDNTLNAATPNLSIPGATLTGSNPMGSLRNNYSAATTLTTILSDLPKQSGNDNTGGGSGNCDEGGGTGMTGIADKIMGPSGRAVSQVNCMFTSSPQSNQDPIARLATRGKALLSTAAALFTVTVSTLLEIGLIGNIDVFAWGFGVIDPIGPTATLISILLLPAFFGLIGIMISLGALLGVYVPLIPYLIFAFGAIGWLTSVIETMVAGPLVALGMLSPSGRHELLGKAEPALMLLLNNFLRPTLMIFGLIAGLLLASVVITMIDTTWGMLSRSIGGGAIEKIIFLGAYVYFVVAAISKCFAAIHIIPERVMRWVGGQGEQYGEDSALEAGRTGATSASQGVQGAASHGGAQAKGRYDEKHKEAADKKRDEAKANLKATRPTDSNPNKT